MDEKTIREVFPTRLVYYMKMNGKTRNDLVRDLGFKYSTIRDWEKGFTVPRMDKVEMLSRYFGCNNSDLIEDKSESQFVSKEIDEKNKKLAKIHFAMIEDPALMLMVEKLASMSSEERSGIQQIMELIDKNK